MDRSWFSKSSPSRHGLLSDSKHELPRWRSPSPMAASMIPPPIVQSTYPASPQAPQKSVVIEKASPLQERQSELEADLQFLLDAQAEGLMKGLEGGAGDDNASTGSATPTAHSVRSASARRAKRPVRKRPGLRSARKGIYNSILALSAIKEGELHSIDGDVQEKEDTLAQIDEWEQKRAGLQTATRNTDDSEETIRAQRLRQDADVLQEEINSVELQLSDMKARHRKMIRQVAAVENSVQAKLASYTSSMSMLEADVQRFLTLKPADSEERPQLQNSKTSIWQLPPERRTLDMAREQYMEDKDAVVQHRQGIAHEKSALQEGAAVWKDVVAQVTDFEKRLRAEMSALSMSSSQSAWEDEPLPQPEHDNSERLKDLLTHLDKTLAHLDAQFKLAEEREWKLLIAAIGAEFDALRQGRSILQNVLGTTSPHTPPHVEHAQDLLDTSAETNGSLRARSESDNDDGNPIHELDRSFETARPAARPSARIEDSDTDVDADDPDPELLFSQQKVGE